MHDEAAYKDRLDITGIEEGIQALVDHRPGGVTRATIRRFNLETDSHPIEPRPEDHPAMEEQPTPTSPPPTEPDYVNHPPHYLAHPSGVECITITEWMNFNLGNAVKYIWRSSDKGATIEDLKKARWYLDREIDRLGRI